jgi:hypothetical protein
MARSNIDTIKVGSAVGDFSVLGFLALGSVSQSTYVVYAWIRPPVAYAERSVWY